MSFTTPPAFNLTRDVSFSPLTNALGRYTQGIDDAKQFETNKLIGDKLAQGDIVGAQAVAAQAGSLDTNLALGKYKMAQETHGLQNTAAQQAIDRDKQTLPLDIQAKRQGITASGLEIDQRRNSIEKELYGRAAAIGQMIEANPDPNAQREMLKRFYDADPRIRGSLEKVLPKEVIDDPIVASRYMRAVAAGYQAPQTMKVGKDDALIGVVRDPNNPGAAPKITQLYKNPGESGFKDEHQLRGELSSNPTIKNFSEIKSGYGRMLEGQNAKTGAGDLAIVYGYMKMLDPTSVVREGEFATAEKTAGVPEQIRTIYNKVLNGERLSPAVRDNFLGMSNGLYRRAEADVGKIQDQYRSLAQRYNMNPDNIILNLGIASPPPGQPNAPAFNPPANFGRVIRGEAVDKPEQQRLAPIPPDAVRALQSNPQLKDQFEAKYGPGSAGQFLQQR